MKTGIFTMAILLFNLNLLLGQNDFKYTADYWADIKNKGFIKAIDNPTKEKVEVTKKGSTVTVSLGKNVYKYTVDKIEDYSSVRKDFYVKNSSGVSRIISISKMPTGKTVISIEKIWMIPDARLSSIQVKEKWIKTNIPNKNSINCAVSYDSIILVGISGPQGLWKSEDNGNTWSNVRGWYSDFGIESMAIDSNVVFVGNSLGIYMSLDFGKTWAKSGLDNKTVSTITINNNSILAGVNAYGTYLSNDFGKSWNNLKKGLLSSNIISSAIVDGDLIVGTPSFGIYISKDKGGNWYSANDNLNGNEISVNAIAINSSNIFIGTSNGVFLSTNKCASWVGINKGLSSYTIVNSISILQNNSIIIGTNYGLFISKDNGANWTNILKDRGIVKVLSNNKRVIFISDNDGVWKCLINEL